MAQEFSINSSAIESKINQLLPSQGGFGAGVDFSASTMVIPIVDLTESAEGSSVRQDLQTSLSLTNVTSTSTVNTTNTIVTTTGYYRVFGTAHFSSAGIASLDVTDGTTTKVLLVYYGVSGQISNNNFDFIVYLSPGVSLRAISSSASQTITTITRQIADVNGNLTETI